MSAKAINEMRNVYLITKINEISFNLRGSYFSRSIASSRLQYASCVDHWGERIIKFHMEQNKY